MELPRPDMVSTSGTRLVCTGLAGAGWEDDADNETIEGKRFGENEDEDHAHEQLRLLSVGPVGMENSKD